MATDYFEGQEEMLEIGKELEKIKVELEDIEHKLESIRNEYNGNGRVIREYEIQQGILEARLELLKQRKGELLGRAIEIGFIENSRHQLLKNFEGPKN